MLMVRMKKNSWLAVSWVLVHLGSVVYGLFPTGVFLPLSVHSLVLTYLGKLCVVDLTK